MYILLHLKMSTHQLKHNKSTGIHRVYCGEIKMEQKFASVQHTKWEIRNNYVR